MKETHWLTINEGGVLIAVEAESYADALLVKDAIDDNEDPHGMEAQIVGAWETWVSARAAACRP